MIERKPLIWFVGISFVFSWILFAAPALLDFDAAQKQMTTQGLWALGMWGPGLAAILVTLFVEKKPFSSLRLNTLGAKRFYLWAWILPIVLILLTGVLTALFGIAEFDPDFGMIRDAMKSAPGSESVPVGVVVAIQVAVAFTIAPVINMLFTVGEELGWRGYLLPKLLPLGQMRAILLGGVIWGLWHAPVIVQGHNYPGYPVLGVFMMIVFCMLLGAILSWLTLNTRSPWVAALGHGSVNAVAGLPVLFFKPGFDMALGGTLATPVAWIGMIAFIIWLVATKRLPVEITSADNQAEKSEFTP